MKYFQSLTLVFIFTTMMLTFSPQDSYACSCMEPPGVGEELARSQAVFSGEVLEVNENRNLNGYTTKQILFQVKDIWKGLAESQIVIATGQGGGDCGIDFQVGNEYVVYATESDMYGTKQLQTNICDRTKPLSSASEDLEILGDGEQPSKNIDLTKNESKKSNNIWSISGGMLLILVFSAILLKRRRH